MTIESVMHGLEPMLQRGRPKAPECVCRTCSETNPKKFGADLRQCLACRRIEDAKRRLRIKQDREFNEALDTLKVINSFPPRAEG